MVRTVAPGTRTVLVAVCILLCTVVALATAAAVAFTGSPDDEHRPAPAAVGACLTTDLRPTDCRMGAPTWIVVGHVRTGSTPATDADRCAEYNAFATTTTTDPGTTLCLTPIWEDQS